MTRSILITGCSSGIGYAAAHALHQRGYKVIASCRQVKDVERLQTEGLTAIQLDLADQQSIDSAVELTLQLTDGKLDALFNNGAYGLAGALEDLPTDGLRAQFESNFFGWHELTRQLLPYLLARPYARIIQNSSVLGFAAAAYRGAYNSSKFALEGWTDTMRLELRDTPVKIALLEPGPIETRFRANALAAFYRWIDMDSSRHATNYQQQINRLSGEKSTNKHTLSPEACIPDIIHALEAKTPKLRYRITKPTKVAAWLKRLLPGRVMDTIMSKSS